MLTFNLLNLFTSATIFLSASIILALEQPWSIKILGGDFNGLDLTYFQKRTGLLPLVHAPTRGEKTLDRIYVSEMCYQTVKVVTSTIKSNHKAIIALSGGNIASLNKTRRRSHFRRRSQHASLLRELQVLDLDLPDIVHSGGLQEALGLFYADVHERLDRLYPVKGITMTSSEALTLTSYVLR